MRRTQLYLDDQLWNALHARARNQKTTVSHLVREAIRERYLGGREQRMKAMLGVIGIRKGTDEPRDAVKYIQSLRRSDRLKRLYQE